ncbi:Lysophospholipase L1 [Solitalea koreensis]|uniref:Lysophospholipase L1 n=2 Tax=Solitalea koreensis TaxID=543615 RepID=A0A521CXL9_9SPHI|nr:Lysophospholipase L1 [Solitalea koreensis]
MNSFKTKRILFFGDSITELGVQPGGFISKIQEALLTQGLSKKYELIGSGISGNKVYDLYLRLENDVLAKQPDVVIIWVGVNDVWHKQMFGTGTDPGKFQVFYQVLIDKIKDKGAEVVLCTPAVIGEKTDFSNPQDGDLNQYAKLIRELAHKNNCEICDFRSLFLEYNKVNNTSNAEWGILTKDRVHLNNTGNELVAKELMKVLQL